MISDHITDDQIALLREPLRREHVKERQQAGRRLSYLEGWHVIAEANRIFGFDGWSRSVVDCRQVVERETQLSSGRDGWRVGYIAQVRIEALGVQRVGTGFGSGIDADLGAAHESAIKEAETDATKRALMTFGNPFGLALYDKTQAEVADTPRPTMPASTAPLPHRDDTLNDTDRRIAEAAYKRIRSAIRMAKTPTIVDQIIEINKADIAVIKQVSEHGYDEVMAMAVARSNELRAGA